METLTQDLLVILSVILVDGLLSVDNALVLAEMVRKLPTKRQRTWALRAGLLGAYALRGASLFLVSFIIANPWLKLLGAFYLIYLMCENLGVGGAEEHKRAVKGGFWTTVIAIELADLSFSLDNIVAAVAFSPKIWIVCIGVFISILAMRFVAGWFVGLIDRFPILGKIAYVLVGMIGGSLLLEQVTGIEVHGLRKVIMLVSVIAGGIIYERIPFLQKLFNPLFMVLARIMGVIARLIDIVIMNPLKFIFGYLWMPFGWVFGRIFKALGINVEFSDEDNDDPEHKDEQGDQKPDAGKTDEPKSDEQPPPSNQD